MLYWAGTMKPPKKKRRSKTNRRNPHALFVELMGPDSKSSAHIPFIVEEHAGNYFEFG
jgi:hypothetical protein